MFKKLSNKTLLLLFAVLGVIAVSVYLFDRNRGERTFKTELFKIDSAAITSVTIYPKGKTDGPLKLTKAGKGWEILSGNKKYPADTSVIKSLLGTLSHITPERVSGTDKESWKTFELTDSASYRVVIEEGANTTADLRVGKVSFSQDGGGQGYGGRNMIVKSHIRAAGDDRVYVIDGFLSLVISDNPSQFRNHMLVKFDPAQVTRMTFSYPGDSSFVLAKENGKWTLNGQPADSASVVSFVNATARATGSEYADEGTPMPPFLYTMKIEGNNLSPVDVYGALDPVGKKYYVRSSMNTLSVFGSSTPALFSQVFPGKTKFFPKETSKKGNH